MDSHILYQSGGSCCHQMWNHHVLLTGDVLMEIVRQSLMGLMGLPCFGMHQGVAKDGVRRTKTPRHRRPLNARSRHRSLQRTGGPRFDGSTPDGNPQAFRHRSRSVRMGAWMKARYTACLGYYETGETGCCFQYHCSNSWSYDSGKTQSQRCGDAWYKEGGVMD